eukprot:ANDGO_03029.mRNA.1 V-type proton ATPase subunit E
MSQVDKQIEQMITFIKQEAEDKAREIAMQAEEEFTREKQTLIEQEKEKIRRDYEKKEKQIEVERKIARSNDIKNCRLKVLKARDDVVNQVREECRSSLPMKPSRDILKNVIVQAVLKMRESEVKIRCRDVDVAEVQAVLATAQQEARQKLQNQTLTITLDSARISKDDCKAGGVIATGYNDRISVNNTMDQRMELAFEQNLPLVRKVLFGIALN